MVLLFCFVMRMDELICCVLFMVFLWFGSIRSMVFDLLSLCGGWCLVMVCLM